MSEDNIGNDIGKLVALLTPISASDAKELLIQYETYNDEPENNGALENYIKSLIPTYFEHLHIESLCNTLVSLLDKETASEVAYGIDFKLNRIEIETWNLKESPTASPKTFTEFESLQKIERLIKEVRKLTVKLR